MASKTNRRFVASVWSYLERNGEATTSEIADYMMTNDRTKFHARRERLGAVLSKSILFEKVGVVKTINASGNNSTNVVWKSRSLKEIVDKAIKGNVNSDKFPKFFKEAIDRRREMNDRENC